jgi:DNA-binding NarL/FixJ family response regulator
VSPAGGSAGAIRVLVVDDQPLMRQGFRLILSAQPGIEVVGEAADGFEAVERVAATCPDVVLMDIRMPGLDGIEATRRITGSRVLILTTFGHDEYVVEALRAGASGFLLKDATPEELTYAVRVVAGGESLLAPSVTTALLARVLPALGPSSPAPKGPSSCASPVPAAGAALRNAKLAASGLADLTDREVEVLKLVAAGKSNAEIAADLYVSDTTVKTHVSHVLGKLGLRDRVQAVVLAFEAGLVGRPFPESPAEA